MEKVMVLQYAMESSSHGNFVNDTYWLSVGSKGMSVGIQTNGAVNPEWHWVTLSQ